MKLILESTEKVVTLRIDGADVPARIWQGQTPDGVPVHCYITRVAVAKDLPAESHAAFEAELLRQPALMRADVRALDMRFFID